MNGLKYQQRRLKLAARRQRIKDFYSIPGVSLADVASKFKITRGRVWQIVKEYQKAVS